MPKYFDIHSHINFENFDVDRDEVISRAKESNTWMINVGTGLQTSKEVVKLAEENEGMFAIIGLHPLYVNEERFNEEEFERLIQNPNVVGIGECGMDFSRLKNEEEKVIQQEDFEKQIRLAVKYEKPIMIHCRDAYPEVLEILASFKEEVGDKLRVNFHFFAGTEDQARQILSMGFFVSFTGVITFAKDYIPLVNLVPLDRMMSETDCPFVAPVPHRGKRCEPGFVKEVIKKIAEIKGLDEEVVRVQIIENIGLFFKIPVA